MKKNVPKRYCVGAGGHTSRGGVMGRHRAMVINNEGKMIEKDCKNVPKRYCMGVGGHRSRSRQWGDTGGDGNQQ